MIGTPTGHHYRVVDYQWDAQVVAEEVGEEVGWTSEPVECSVAIGSLVPLGRTSAVAAGQCMHLARVSSEVTRSVLLLAQTHRVVHPGERRIRDLVGVTWSPT